jgi:hypothetical protein
MVFAFYETVITILGIAFKHLILLLKGVFNAAPSHFSVHFTPCGRTLFSENSFVHMIFKEYLEANQRPGYCKLY